MGPIDPEASARLQSELSSGERILWAGKPNPGVIFHSDDWYLIPFSLMWGGFAIFWESGVLGFWGHNSKGAPIFMAIWGIPFVVIGQYLIWGRFFFDAWIKRRTYYGVTNRRVLVVQEAWSRKTSSMYIDAIPNVERNGEVTGTLWFGPKIPTISGNRQTRGWSRYNVGYMPVFADIDDVDSVYRLVLDLREKASSGQGTSAAVFRS